jgi:hypothetical protein
MTNRVAVLGVAAALALVGCASGPRPSRALGASRAAPRTPPRGARAAFPPARFEDVFANAVEVLRERGRDIASCDPELGAVATAPVEIEAPCWGTTCLARETTQVKLGYRRARVTLVREVWDPGLRAWRPSEDVTRLEEIAREEREIVDRILGVAAVAPRPRVPRLVHRDPCPERSCAGASCIASSAVPGR